MASPVRDAVVREIKQITELRHQIHSHPETAYDEHETSRLIARQLIEWQIEHKTGLAGGTGVLGFLPSTEGDDAPCIALRADIDALPILEENDLPYKSKVDGKMHACGHDGHTAILLGTARALAQEKRRPNHVLLMFQPAEEGGAGGKKMCEDGVLDGSVLGKPADAAYGLHGWAELELGKFGVREGPLLASTDQFYVTIRGRGGHAAMPHFAADPVVAAAHIVTALQTVASRNVDPLESIVMTVGKLQAGTAVNIIPDEAYFAGTMRTLNDDTRALGKNRFYEIVESVTKALGCEVEIKWNTGYPVTFNEKRATDRLRNVLVNAFGQDKVQEVDRPVMGGEDFSFYGQHVPASFFLVGLKPDHMDTYPKVHTPKFNFNDDAIPFAIEAMCRLALEPLELDKT
ncbi:MAG: M20 metallopeptidase family protein [Fimbriimonadaceae bacterium]